jgi:beta-glucosidase
VSFVIENSGQVKGSEVPQVYVGLPAELPPAVSFPVKKLVGFDRIELSPHQKKSLSVHVSSLELSYWSTEAQDWVLGTGERTIYVAASSRDIRLQGRARIGKGHDRN